MKNKLLFLLLLLSGMAGAQVVNIPDAVFKNRLLNASTSNGIAKDSSGNNMLIDINDDNEIQVIEAQAVWDLNVSNGGVQSMEGIQAFTNLRNLVCTNNDDLTELNLQGMTNLVTLDLTHNSLVNLVFTGCTGLADLICNMNNLTTLDLTGLSNLESLSCKACGLTQIDLSPVNLNRFIGGYNPFTSVDFSSQSNLHTFSLMGCGNLTSVYLKNGSVQSMFGGEPFYDCPNLAYICLDEEEVLDAYISNIPNIANVVFSTTCDGSGNENNHIIGAVKFDANNNGCDNSDPIHSFIKVKSDHDGNSSSIWTNAYGYYCHIAGIGDYTISIDLEDSPYFTVAQPPVVTFNALEGSIATQDLCISPLGVHADLEVTVAADDGIAAGRNQNYWLTYKNTGNQVLNGTVVFNFNDDAQNFVSASSPYTSASTGLLSWNFSGLQPFKSRTIRVILHTNTATSTPPVLLGDILNFSFIGNISQTDETPQNNQVNFSQVVNASYDPNNMVCLQGATEPEDRIGEYLNYTINFENIGTAAADFVVVATQIDTAKYDINSLQVLTASHPVIAKLEGNVITFRFNNINLAPDGGGNAVFKIKSLATLNAGDVVMSKASIVFDSNPAIETNEAVTTFESAAEVKDFSGNEVKLYPNPTSSIIKVQSAYPIVSVSVYNVQGSLLETAIINDTNTTIDLSSRASGIYFVKVTTDKGVKVENVIRE